MHGGHGDGAKSFNSTHRQVTEVKMTRILKHRSNHSRGRHPWQPPDRSSSPLFELDFERYPSPRINLEKAVRNNRIYMHSLGWQRYFDQIVAVLGFTHFTPDELQFAEAVATWQQQQRLQGGSNAADL